MFDQLHNGFEFSGLSPARLFLPVDAAAYVSRTATRIGYDVNTVSQPIRDRLRAIIQSGMDAVRMGGIGRMTAVDSWDAEGISGRGMAVKSAQWGRVVARMVSPRQMVCFVLTLGEEFDRVKEQTALFDAYVLDGFGSELIEQAAVLVEQHLARWAQNNAMGCSRRFSPGYCDWPLAAGQKEIFVLLNPAAIGVKALSTGAMLPSKSISAVMITADQVPLAYPCPFCKNTKCDHRRA
jgi:hypothetical protein